MRCHDTDETLNRQQGERTFLLMGNPNVGKSVIFSKLTGREVLAANYTGTTVSFTQGKVGGAGREATLIDVPGTYSLEATSPAEEVAVDMLKRGADAIICVLDATNLERNLNLALQVMKYDVPIVFALNLLDVAERQGVSIDVLALERELGAPVIPTVAVRDAGLAELLEKAWSIAGTQQSRPEAVDQEDQASRWQQAERIAALVSKEESNLQRTFWDKLGDWTMQPFPGLPIALVVLSAALGLVVGGGKALRATILLPLINDGIVPIITSVVSRIVPEGVFLNVLVGEYGVLVKGIEWPFALILPYVFLFYVVLSIMEDSGYLPRLGVLMDGVMRRIGIPGGNVVPFFMGYGCAVPAILGTRAATSYKERLLVSALVTLAVPCAAQTGAFFALLGDRSALVLVLVYLLSFVAMFIAGLLLNRVVRGKSDPMLLEIPNLLVPNRKALVRKISIRARHFIMEAEVPMMLGIALAALLVETGALNSTANLVQPIIVNWLGLPEEASLALILGIIRREMAVLPLVELDLTTLQLFVGSVVALFYMPCLSVFAALLKEFGLKMSVAIALGTTFLAIFLAGLINQAAGLIGIV